MSTQHARRGLAALVTLVAVVACGDIRIADSPDFGTATADTGGDSTSSTDTTPAEDASSDVGSGNGPCEYGKDEQCDDGSACTVDECLITEVCAHKPLENGCKIDSSCYVDGATADGNRCQVCDPSRSKNTWTTVTCDDGKPCTRDECTASSGCVYLADDALPCDDGLPCSTDDHCSAGACAATACSCAIDGDCVGRVTLGPCERAACESEVCVARPDAAKNGQGCDDLDACTSGDTCTAGACGGATLPCAALAGPCLVVTCDAGACSYAPKLAGTACTARSACVTGATCSSGGNCDGAWDTTNCGCTSPADCDDGLACTEALCDGGACAVTPTAGACHLFDGCVDAGSVHPTNACLECDPPRAGDAWSSLDCDDSDACTDDGCDPASGCMHTPKPGCCASDADCGELTAGQCEKARCQAGACAVTADPGQEGQPCDDGNLCTGDGVCGGGVCAPGPTAPLDGLACDDGVYCTTSDACSVGQCVGGGPRDCSSATSSGCVVGTCDETAGACVGAPVTDGADCSDGDPCTDDDSCSAGVCGGLAKDCSGLVDACHSAACSDGTCQSHVLTGTTCDDTNTCTTGDACDDGGLCVGSWDVGACGCANDAGCASLADACHVGRCDTKTGECHAEPTSGQTCDDGQACTFADACNSAGVCTGTAYTCTPATNCQLSACDGTGQCTTAIAAGQCYIEIGGVPTCVAADAPSPSNSCVICAPTSSQTAWTVAANGTTCAATSECGKPGTCQAAQCVSAGPRPSGTPCGDPTAAPCNGPDQCNASGVCLPGYTAPGTACDDGDATTVSDSCNGLGACTGTSCTADAQCGPPPTTCFGGAGRCVAATGRCTWVPKDTQTDCDDGDVATVGDRCDGAGVCVGQPPCTPGSCKAPLGPCELPDGLCDTNTGVCSYAPKAAGTLCDDKDPATIGDQCGSDGACRGAVDTAPWISTFAPVRTFVGATIPSVPFFAGEGTSPLEAGQTTTVTVISSSAPAIIAAASVTTVCQDAGHGCVGKLVFSAVPTTLGTVTLTIGVSDGVTTSTTAVTVQVLGCAPGSVTLSATGDFVVPTDCAVVTVKAWGGGGGAGGYDGAMSFGFVGGPGGGGGYAESTVAVTGGQTLHVTVGGGGKSGICPTPISGGGGTYAGGLGGNNGPGGDGAGTGLGGAGGLSKSAGDDGGAGKYGGGGGGAGTKAGGAGGGATVVTNAAGLEVVIAGGGGGGGGANSPDVGGAGGGGGGVPGEAITGAADGGGGGGGGASVGTVASPANGALPSPAAPNGLAVGGLSSNTTNCALASGAAGVAVIEYAGGTAGIGVRVADASAFEGEALSFDVRIVPTDPALPVTFDWAVRGLSAREGVDFGAASGSVSVPIGGDLVGLTVPTMDTTAREGLRFLELTVSHVTNAVVLDATGLGRIGDDETCAADEHVLDADGGLLLGLAPRYADVDGDGYTAGQAPACVLVGHPPPAGFSDTPVAPPQIAYNAAVADEAAGSAALRTWSNDAAARVATGYASAINLDAGGETTLFRLTDWRYAVPTNATVVGVRVHLRRAAAACATGAVSDAEVRLLVGGLPVGDNRATTGLWPLTEGELVYGGATDTWGLTLTPAIINAADFGVGVRATSAAANCEARLYHVWVEVFLDTGDDCAPTDATRWTAKDLYVDADADLYDSGKVAGVCLGAVLPAPYATGYSRSTWGTDCYDSNANAHPGQTAYYTTSRGDGSFDYNCDGTTAKNTSTCDTCSCTISGICATFTGGTCTIGAASVAYTCAVQAATGCGAAVTKGACSVPYVGPATTCTASKATISTGTGTHTTFCSTAYPGYGNRDGVLADDVTYTASTCSCL